MVVLSSCVRRLGIQTGRFLQATPARHASTQARATDALKRKRRSQRIGAGVAGVSAVILVANSYQTRQWRRERIVQLDLASDDDVWNSHCPTRSRESVIELVRRVGLMGLSSRSVQDELDRIRTWHHEHGYKGGLVLRDLTKPLFAASSSSDTEDDEESAATGWTFEEVLADPMRLARRECYYLYYEVTGTGQIRQQIFCRGVTLQVDILTCLQFWMVQDKSLGNSKVHQGFRNQADRILADVLPLLAPPTDPRATIEVCGHSLGGAVATILAAKLRDRGYKVIRLTTVGEPRFCASPSDADTLHERLPADHLRIENELDFVPFVPPFASHAVGNKLWLVSLDGSEEGAAVRFVVPRTSDAGENGTRWTDSFWTNFLAPETIASNGRPHRIPSYVQGLQRDLCSGSEN